MTYLRFVWCLLFLLSLDSVNGTHLLATEQPNVVFVLVDNLGYGDIGCFGSTKHRTPNIDRLANEGVRLTSFYNAAPVCTPSRASGHFKQSCKKPRLTGLRLKGCGCTL